MRRAMMEILHGLRSKRNSVGAEMKRLRADGGRDVRRLERLCGVDEGLAIAEMELMKALDGARG